MNCPNLCGQYKNSSYGSFFNPTIGGLFFLLSVFTGLVHNLYARFYYLVLCGQRFFHSLVFTVRGARPAF